MKNILFILAIFTNIILMNAQSDNYLKDAIMSKIRYVQSDPIQNSIAQETGWYDQMNTTLLEIENNPSQENLRDNNDCSSANFICFNDTYEYPLGINSFAEQGPDYACLSTQPNPIWYYFKVSGHSNSSNTGYLDLSMSANQDIDFIIWGPFDYNTCDNFDLSENNVLDCSYLPTNNEMANIPTENGKYYMMLITNYSNVEQNFTISQIGGTAITDCSGLENISGNVYLDADEDCLLTDDDLIEDMFIRFNPGNYFAGINLQGKYNIHLPLGTYTYSFLSPIQNSSACTDTIVISDTTDYNIDLPFLIGTNNDPTIHITCPSIIGNGIFYININNYGLTPSSGTILLSFDVALTVLSASVPFTIIDEHTIEVQYSDLHFLQPQIFTVVTNTLSTVDFLGYTAVSIAEIISDSTDSNLDNNISKVYSTVKLPLDPNNISASPQGNYDFNETDVNETEITYTINFQNTGNAPATNVYILDEIPEVFDFSSIQLIASSHDCELQIPEEGVIKFNFDEINLLDSLNNEPESHGWVVFKLSLSQELTVGTSFDNQAGIFFDDNPEILTNTVTNYIISNAPTTPLITYDDCIDAITVCNLNNTYATTPEYSNTSGIPNDFCGPNSSAQNIQWVKFYAGDATITFTFTITNCQNSPVNPGNGIQAVVYSSEDCVIDNMVQMEPCVSTNGVVVNDPEILIYTVDNLTPGFSYFLLIDGWAGDVCDYTINISPQDATTYPVLDPEPIESLYPEPVCPEGNTPFFIPDMGDGVLYSWSASNGASIIYEYQENVVFNFPESGTYDICITVELENSDCAVPPVTECKTVLVENLEPVPIDTILCGGESIEFLGSTQGTFEEDFEGTVIISNYYYCDSIIELNLSFLDDELESSVEACLALGDTLWLGNMPITEMPSENPSYILIPSQLIPRCDSIIELDLTVLDISISQYDSILITNDNVEYSYQWLDCNNDLAPIDGEINSTFVPISEGSYAVEVTYNDCILISNCFVYILDEIYSLENKLGVTIQPNPVFDNLFIDIGENTEINIEIFDNLGRKIYSNIQKTQIEEIDFSSFSTGFYFVAISDNKNRIISKVVKY